MLIVGADGDGAVIIVEVERAVFGIDEEVDASEADDFVKDNLYIEGNVIVKARGGVSFDVTLDDFATNVFVGAFVEHTEEVAFGEVALEFFNFLTDVGELMDGGVLLVDCDFHGCYPFVFVWVFPCDGIIIAYSMEYVKSDYGRLRTISGGYPHSNSQKLVFSHFFKFFAFFSKKAFFPTLTQAYPRIHNKSAFPCDIIMIEKYETEASTDSVGAFLYWNKNNSNYRKGERVCLLQSKRNLFKVSLKARAKQTHTALPIQQRI